jgi:hypothetical protein
MSLRLENTNRFVGILFTASIGILATLLTLFYLDRYTVSTVVESSLNVDTYPATWASGPSSGSSYIVENPSTVFPVQDINEWLNINEWQNQMFRNAVEIVAGVTIVLGILHLGLKRLFRQVSEEVFP